MKTRLLHLVLGTVLALPLLYATSEQAHAQIPRFQTVAGTSTHDVGRSIKQLPDSGYVVAGYAQRLTSNYDVYLVRLDQNGNVLWSFTYDIGGNDYAYHLDIASDGGFVVTGKTQNTNNCTADDIFLLKTTNTGVLVWTRTFGGNGDEEGTCVQTTTDGGFIVSGMTNSFGAGNYDAFLLKTNSTGNLTWWKTYGGSNMDYFKSVQQTTDGGYIAGGGSLSYGNGSQSFLVKVNSTGDFTGAGWARNFGGTGTELIWSVRQTNDGGYITAGVETSYTPTPDVFLVKFSNTGGFLWARTYEFSSNWDEALSVKETCTGELIFSGYCQGSGFAGLNGYVLKTTNVGAKIWSRAYGGATGGEYAWEIIQTSDGGYAFAGQTTGWGAGNNDAYIVKMESAAGSSFCNDILLNEPNTQRTLTPGTTLPAISQLNLEFTVTSTRFTYGQWQRLCFDPGTSYGNPCVMSGLWQNTATMGGAPEQIGVVGFVQDDVVDQVLLKQFAGELEGQFRVVPNPVEQGGPVVLQIPSVDGEVTLTIVDMLGRVVHQQRFTQMNAEEAMKISTSGWSDGNYIVSLKTASGVRTTPMVIRR